MTRETPNIVINMDKACWGCGNMGVGGRGLCLKCATENLKSKERVMGLGNKAIQSIGPTIGCMLSDYQEKLRAAYLKADGDLNISFSVKVGPDQAGNRVRVDMTFTAEKIKDSTSFIVDENQKSLFEPEDADVAVSEKADD